MILTIVKFSISNRDHVFLRRREAASPSTMDCLVYTKLRFTPLLVPLNRSEIAVFIHELKLNCDYCYLARAEKDVLRAVHRIIPP